MQPPSLPPLPDGVRKVQPRRTGSERCSRAGRGPKGAAAPDGVRKMQPRRTGGMIDRRGSDGFDDTY